MDNNNLAKQEDAKEMRYEVPGLELACDPDTVLIKAKQELKTYKPKAGDPAEGNIFKVMTLSELQNGTLLSIAVPEAYNTFGIHMLRQLQKEYDCNTPSEKATAELVALNFVRTLAIQFKINARLERGEIGDIGVQYLNMLSKELDRANRHYLNSLQALKMMKQPMLSINIKTQTAVVGQNQVVQSNHE